MLDNKHYKVVSRDNLKDIGKVIKPGILGEIRPQLSPEEKEKRAIQAKIRHMNKHQSHILELTRNYDTMSKKERRKATQLIKEQHAHELAEATTRWQRNQLKRSKRKVQKSLNNNINNN